MNYKKVINKTVIISMLLAAVTWGAWAYFINKDSQNVLATTLLQIIYSSLMTLYMSFSIYFIFSKFKNKWYKLILPTIGTVGHTGALLVFAHYLNHTQNLFKTVSLPLLVGVGYSLFLTWKIYSKAKNKTNSVK